MDVQFVAYWLNGDGTQELLDPDLHISGAKITRDLGVGRLSGSLPPEVARLRNHNNRLVLQEWATAIYVMVDGLVFDAFILTEITDNDTTVSIDCVGWLGYLQGMPFTGNINRNNYQPRWAIQGLINSLSSGWSGADIGWSFGFYGEENFPLLGVPDPDDLPPIRALPGKPAPFRDKQPVAPKRSVSNYQTKYNQYRTALNSWRSRRDKARDADRKYQEKVRERTNLFKERARALDSAAYKINWWSTHDILRELQSVLGDIGAHAKMVHSLSASGVGGHRLEVFATQRRRLHSVEFVDGENVMTRPKLTRGGLSQAKTVQVLGAGEGSKMLKHSAWFAAGGAHGLQRVTTYADKSIRSRQRASVVARDLVSRRRRVWDYDSLQVIDSGFAPLRTFDVGDEIMYRTLDRRGLEVEAWVLVSEIEIDVEQDVMNIGVVPAGEVQT